MSLSTGSSTALRTASAGTGLVPLGAGGVGVFPLNLGGNVFGWTADEAASVVVLDAYVAAGGNFVDTANVYSAWVEGNSGGESESILGRWLTAREHHGSVHIATKVGMLGGEDLSAHSVRSALTASLRRLQADSVALYYAHRDEPERPVEEIVDTFAGLVADGSVGAYGLSNWGADRLVAAVAHADAEGLPLPAAIQNEESAVVADDPAVAALARDRGILRLPYSTLASGFLTGKYTRGGDLPESARAGKIAGTLMNDHGWAVLDAVRGVAEGRGVAIASIALAWLRSTGAVPIASARTPEQLEPLVAGVELELSAAEIDAITGAGAA